MGTFLFFLFSFLRGYKKHKNAKQTIFTLLEVFMRALLAGFGSWRVFVILCLQNFFVKKEFKTALITSLLYVMGYCQSETQSRLTPYSELYHVADLLKTFYFCFKFELNVHLVLVQF